MNLTEAKKHLIENSHFINKVKGGQYIDSLAIVPSNRMHDGVIIDRIITNKPYQDLLMPFTDFTIIAIIKRTNGKFGITKQDVKQINGFK